MSGPAREIVLGDTTFKFGKMLAEEAFELLEELRPGLAPALTDLDIPDELFDGDEEAIKKRAMVVITRLVASVISSVPPNIIRSARNALFRHVRYTSKSQPTPTVLATDVNNAFDGLEAVHIYLVLGRAFAVNFLGSWGVLQSHIPGLENLHLPDIET